ncbi:hypothetical protein KI688_004185 [Linnemannia hyalina]|uniref:Uncharacterized protein n=1 Tax=Linnemannia hyalina TaxID=64524 RepID=A0A9P7XMM9_9FUNG|nr:hypothetical protein KI688_004185 [Linnemannia hyalina]
MVNSMARPHDPESTSSFSALTKTATSELTSETSRNLFVTSPGPYGATVSLMEGQPPKDDSFSFILEYKAELIPDPCCTTQDAYPDIFGFPQLI